MNRSRRATRGAALTVTATVVLTLTSPVLGTPPSAAAAVPDPVPGLVSAQVGVRTTPNTSADLGDADLLGNGDILVSTYGPAEALSFNVSKTDLFKDGSKNASTGAGTNAMPMRAGAVTVKVPALTGGATYRQEQDPYRAEVRTVLTKGATAVTLRSRVPSTANNLLVTDVTNSSMAALPVTVDTAANSSFAADGATTAAGTAAGGTAWAARTGPTPQGWGPKNVPFVMRAAMATRVLGATPTVTSDATTTSSSAFTVPAGATVSVVTQVTSTGGDALTATPADPVPVGAGAVAAVTAASLATADSAHLQWWDAFWHESWVDLTAEPLLMRYYYGALYALGSSNRAGKFAPGLNGWNGTDTPQWQSDYTTNYNVQAPYYGVYSANRPELAQSYYKAILSINDEQAKAYATERGFQGTYFRTHYGPHGIQTEKTASADWGQRTNAIESAINFLNDYAYTRDLTTLRDTSYPFLRDVADFWDAYLVKDASGRYVVNDSAVAEGDGAHNVNPTTALAYLRTFYTGILAASTDLNLDAGRRAKWQDILAHLSDYTTVAYQGRTVFSFSENNPSAEANPYPYNLYPVSPANVVGIESPLAAVARNTIDTRPSYWTQGNSFPQVYPAAVKAGYPASAVVAQMKGVLGRMGPNNVYKQGGGGLETAGAIEAIDAMLLQSTDGVVRWFPNWTGSDASFTSQRAVGAFTASGRTTGGVVQQATITSEKGQPLTVQNPWPGRDLVVSQVGGATVTTTTTRALSHYSFPTTAGASYTLAPAGGIPPAAQNAAVYRTVTASSSLESRGWGTAALVDGFADSTAGSMGWTSTASTRANHTESVTVDLGDGRPVAGVTLAPRNDAGNVGAGFPVDLTVQVSPDGVTWTTVVTRTATPLPTAAQTYRFASATTQYVRVTGTSLRPNPADDNQYRMQFAELSVS